MITMNLNFKSREEAIVFREILRKEKTYTGETFDRICLRAVREMYNRRMLKIEQKNIQNIMKDCEE